MERLKALPGSVIDFSDLPEWKAMPGEFEIAKFYRPIKKAVSLRIDLADLTQGLRR